MVVSAYSKDRPTKSRKAARARPVPLTDRLPFRLAQAGLAIERERQVSARPHAQLRRWRARYFAGRRRCRGDVRDLVAGEGRLAGPGDGARQQVGIDRLGHARCAAGEGQVQPCLASQRG